MLDINRHKFFLVQILKDIYNDIELANYLGLKGGSALMFFYDLPRFSIDLDFDLLNNGKEDIVYEKVRKMILKYGKIHDEAKKHFGPLIVLDYGYEERKLKVEISKRRFENHYEIKNLLGINMKVMVLPDMFAHKLCALLDRKVIIARDIFDSWFLMKKQTPVNKNIIESRMNLAYKEYIQKCIQHLERVNEKKLLQGLGELMDEEMKKFVKAGLKKETMDLLSFYKDFPIFSQEN